MSKVVENLVLPEDVQDVLDNARSVTIAVCVEDLIDTIFPDSETDKATVSYKISETETVDEVDVVRVKNGISANYRDVYMRRRDPECMVIADERPSDKTRFIDKFGYEFSTLKKETFEWLKDQDLAIYGFELGAKGYGKDALAVCPLNAGFFAFGLGLLQGIVDIKSMDRDFTPKTIIYVAPPFRQTHFDGKQVVVHDRNQVHEIFSYNLYPGPSAKKGVYGAMIERGEQEGWVTAHCSAVQVLTPYDNIVTIMHEGASGGGKSEMLQPPHRLPDGRLLLGRNTQTGEERYLEIPRTCELRPVCDDMGMCHPRNQKGEGKLTLIDAEDAWFVRVDHIKDYGTDPDLEHLTINPKGPQLFLNIDAVAGSTALIWEHIEDEPGKPCPNPRVVIPRKSVPNTVNEPVEVDVRSFGVRTPPCTAENPSYGIIGLMHILPPALAWLWRLVAPRGYANPSIVGTEGMSSEGVGSYWPFTTGKKVIQANLLLEQVRDTPDTRYLLIPNQHIGVWETGFMPEWLVRDYMARRGIADFRAEQITPSRSPLLGYSMRQMRIEGFMIPKWFLQVETQSEVGVEAYDKGAEILSDFFRKELTKFLQPDLDSRGKSIIDCCLAGGSVEDYEKLMS